MRRRFHLLVTVFALAAVLHVEPAKAAPAVKLVLAKTLTQPVALTTRAGEANAVYIAQKTGAVRRLRIAANGRVTLDSTVVLNVSDRLGTQNEQGLHGIAFAPGGGKFYASYTNKAGATRLAEYPYANGRANKSRERILLTIPHPSTHHYAGTIAFGPDKLLYMSIGDGGTGGAPAQDLGSLLGKIIRIRPAAAGGKPYTIPAGNPFVGQAGARPEILHYGFRNPWKWSFDRAGGDMWIGDVGQRLREEVDLAPAGSTGGNFGWNRREGTLPYNGGERPPGAIDPVYEYSHDAGDCSITGGYVYRGSKIPALAGKYVFTDYCRGLVRSLDQGVAESLGVTLTSPVSFGEDRQGELWVLSVRGGVYRLLPA